MSAAALAILGDYVPFGIGQALGERAGGNSLDNTLRVAQLRPDRVGAADIRVHAVADGFGHGLVHLWAEDGTLLGHREPVGHRPRARDCEVTAARVTPRRGAP